MNAATFYGKKHPMEVLVTEVLPNKVAKVAADALVKAATQKISKTFATSSTQTQLSAKTIEQLKDNPSTAMNKRLTFYYQGNGSYKGTGEIKLYWNTSDYAEGKVGKQLVNPLNYTQWMRSLYPSMFSKDFILGTGNDTNGNLTLSNDNTLATNQSIFSMDPNYFVSGNYDPATDDTLLVETITAPEDAFIRLKYVDEYFNIHNFTDCAQYVQIYFFVCNRATNKKPMDFLLQEISAEEDWEQSDMVTPNDNVNVKDGAGAFPFDSNALEAVPNVPLTISRDMKKYWGLFHMESIVLSGNEEIKYRIKHVINRTISKNNVKENEGQFIPGLTILPMVLCQGVLGKFKATSENFTDDRWPSKVTLNNTALGTYTSRMFYFGPVDKSEKTKLSRFASTVYQKAAQGSATTFVNPYVGIAEDVDTIGF